jgi:hypothetical protein
MTKDYFVCDLECLVLRHTVFSFFLNFFQNMHKESVYWFITVNGNSIRLPCAYAPYAKKLYFRVSKNSNEKFHMYIFIIHMRL